MTENDSIESLGEQQGNVAAEAPGDIRMDESCLEDFWQVAKKQIARLRVDVIVGPLDLQGPRPPAWTFTDHPETANRLATLVLQGEKTATSSLYSEYESEGEPLPEVGELSILCDGSGQPVALLTTSNVRVERFDRVNCDHAEAEGEGDGSLAYWRAVHRAFFSQLPGWVGDGSDRIVLEDFSVLYSTGD